MRIVRSGALALVLVLGVGASACANAKKRSEPTSTTTTAPPEQARTSAAKVAAGLAKIDATAAGVASSAASDRSKAQSLADGIELAWRPIEGTIKANDQNAYLAFEDGFAVLGNAAEAGDATRASSAAKGIAAASAAYLKQHPG